jgi:hypothetical protein
MAKALNAFFGPQGLIKRLSKADPDILNRVMVIDVEIATGVQTEVKKSIAHQRRQHVVEEWNPRGNVAHAAALEGQVDLDVRFFRRA